MKASTVRDEFIYDAVLMSADESGRELVFQIGDREHLVRSLNVAHWSAGAVGRLRLASEEHGFAFHAYVDQRLRRAPDLDDPQRRLWAWRIGEGCFSVRAGLLPGKDGRVVRQHTQRQVMHLPREFVQFCTVRGLKPASVLRAFIADLCGLHNWVNCPREDDYSSNGSDERMYAEAYFERCFGWVNDPEYRKSLNAKSKSRAHASES